MKYYSFNTIGMMLLALVSGTNTALAQEFNPISAEDYGNSHPDYPPTNAIDGNTSFASRWAASFDGGSANLSIHLSNSQVIDDVGVAWGFGDQRSFAFEIRARQGDTDDWDKIYSGESSGSTTGIEQYNVDDTVADEIRIKVFSNSAGTDWVDITEFEVYGTGGSGSSGGSDSGGGDSSDSGGSDSGDSGGSDSGGSGGTDSGDSGGSDSGGSDNGADDTINVPGLIQAENFSDYQDNDSNNRGGQYRDTGVDIQNCSDSNCGFNVGWMDSGEWLEYDINVTSSGSYNAQLRVASPSSNGELSIEIDGTRVTDNVDVRNTGGWQDWTTQTVSLGNLSSGNHTLRLNVEESLFNINWILVDSGTGVEEPEDITSGPPPAPAPAPAPTNTNNEFGLNSNAEPWDNFDLSRWSIDTPAAREEDECIAERVWDYEWDDNDPLPNSSEPFFFTHSDGGMRFVTRIDGSTTGDDCDGFVRSELRGMLRTGNESIEYRGVSRNNWKLGYQPGNDNDWGGVNGQLDATLRVNKVTTSGSSSQVGRVIVGQIHAGSDEPLRLYYRKRSGESKGCIYFGHEIRTDDDVWFEMIGDRACEDGPSNGIELDELFSYSIINDDEDITVVIRRGDRNGPIIAQRTIDMNDLDSGYDRSDEWMYFKAGAYTQNDSGNSSDGDIVTFYRLSASHD